MVLIRVCIYHLQMDSVQSSMLLPVIAIVNEIYTARISRSIVGKLSGRFLVVQGKSRGLRHLTDTPNAGGDRTPGSERAKASSC